MLDSIEIKKNLERTTRSTNAYLCYECGRCTSRCPISRFNSGYSPRRTLVRLSAGEPEELRAEDQLWSCLTCRLCELYCPTNVDYSEFIKQVRATAYGNGRHGRCTHGGTLQSLMKVMARPDLQQNRLDWVQEGLQVAEQGDHLYFVGCLPYFDVYFSDLQVPSLKTAVSTVSILNELGIRPVLMKNERCCGHDLLWEGDVEGFRRLARINLEEIKKTGARTVIMSCGECARTFKLDYQEHFGKLPFEVTHLSEFLAGKLEAGELRLGTLDKVVTYQDACRLGRHLGVYEEPRQVLTAIPGIELREMPRNRKDAICCGTSCWTNCDRYSKQIQLSRLNSAQQTGAELLVTTCPKCAIHFRCAQCRDGAVDTSGIEIRDLATLVAEAIKSRDEVGKEHRP